MTLNLLRFFSFFLGTKSSIRVTSQVRAGGAREDQEKKNVHRLQKITAHLFVYTQAFYERVVRRVFVCRTFQRQGPIRNRETVLTRGAQRNRNRFLIIVMVGNDDFSPSSFAVASEHTTAIHYRCRYRRTSASTSKSTRFFFSSNGPSRHTTIFAQKSLGNQWRRPKTPQPVQLFYFYFSRIRSRLQMHVNN